MRLLYLPIFEQGSVHDTQIANKRGLYNALVTAGCDVYEWDYLANDADTRFQGMVNRIEQFSPTHILTQFHGADILTPEQIADLRMRYPAITWLNWSGDSWNHSLTAPAMLALAKQYDLWLVAAPDVLPVYEQEGIHAAYWNIAIETPVGDLPDMPAYDVVFLANVINDKRRALMEWLRTLAPEFSVGIYGDWEHADGRNVYDFGAGEVLYKLAKFAICDNVYPDQQNYISNRPMQALVAGGALVLHQHVPKMEAMTKLLAGVHYVEWRETSDLLATMRYFCDHEDERVQIVNAGRELALAKHTYTERVRELLTELLPSIERVRA